MMKFVKGVPFEGAKKNEALWYLYIDDTLPCINMVTNAFNVRLAEIVRDPHNQIGRDFTTIAIAAVTNTLLDVHLGRRDGYYMNRVGGMCTSLFNIQDTIEADDWPETERVEVSRWPQGIHWYAKVDGIDVSDKEGNMKWNTAKEAERQAEIFKEKMDQTH